MTRSGARCCCPETVFPPGRYSGRDEDVRAILRVLCETTMFFGVGVFTANAAFDFSQTSTRWQTSYLGHLGETLSGYALAYWAYS